MINYSPKTASPQRGLTIRGGTEATLLPRHFAYPVFMFNPMASSYILKFALTVLVSLCISTTYGNAAEPKPKVNTRPEGALRGFDLLALLHPSWPCNATIAALPYPGEPLALGVLWGTFGEKTECLVRILEHRKAPTVLRIHLFNTVCTRRKTCAPDEPLFPYTEETLRAALAKAEPELMRIIAARTDEVRAVIVPLLQRPSTLTPIKCAISPFLEHTLGEQVSLNDAVVRIVQERLPECMIVDNPLAPYPEGRAQSARPPKTLQMAEERHHEFIRHLPPIAKPCFTSMDGDAAFAQSLSWPAKVLQEFKRDSAQCIAAFIWHPSFNCLTISTDKPLPPAERQCPSPQEFRKLMNELPVW